MSFSRWSCRKCGRTFGALRHLWSHNCPSDTKHITRAHRRRLDILETLRRKNADRKDVDE